MFFIVLKRVVLVLIVSLFFYGCNQEGLKSSSKGISINGSSSTISSRSGNGSESLNKSGSSNIKREALVVGISDYAPADKNDLDGIEKDMSKIKSLFNKWGFEVKTLYNAEAMDILEYLDEYSKKLSPNDYFAFYYSGHGSFKPDKNGDEEDGKDETLVLSDGVINKHLPDDLLYEKFNSIKAKKMIFIDSCHSGTAFRSLNSKVKPKSISPDDVKASFKEPTRMRDVSAVRNSSEDFMSGEYIAFSASQDNEESLATPTGSLFTNALYKTFTDSKYLDKPLDTIKDILTEDVVEYAKETNNPPHHPNISFSELKFASKSLDEFLNMRPKGSQNIIQHTPPPQTESNIEKSYLEETLDSLISSKKVDRIGLFYDKSSYKEGESVEFIIDTNGKSGYLTIFYIDGSDVTILYPNPYVKRKKISGKYKFPDDFSNGKFELEAYKSCRGCDSERTVIYVLLTSEPVTSEEEIKDNKLLSFSKESNDEKFVTRAVRLKVNKSQDFKPLLGKYEFIVK